MYALAPHQFSSVVCQFTTYLTTVYFVTVITKPQVTLSNTKRLLTISIKSKAFQSPILTLKPSLKHAVESRKSAKTVRHWNRTEGEMSGKDWQWSKAVQGNPKVGGSGNNDVELDRSQGQWLGTKCGSEVGSLNVEDDGGETSKVD
ncbi:hypothetical protein EDB83DRAFT_2322703 [Lactarius deliciosus]|nr:hypothetical protein EDB83DRAFT_2322703 [Lactarius deliciosus]